MGRIILSVIAGFIVAAVLSSGADFAFESAGIFPPIGQPFFDNGLLAIAFLYRAVFSILGAYVTALIAKDNAQKAVLIIGILGSILWLIGGIVMWEYGPAWYNIGGAITGVPFSLIALKLYERRVNQLNVAQ